MDAIAVPDTVWKMLTLKYDSDVNAIKTWLISLRYAKADNRTNKCKPITEIVLIDATQIATLKHQREFINSQSKHTALIGVLVVVKVIGGRDNYH
jgi:hypothetical protein